METSEVAPIAPDLLDSEVADKDIAVIAQDYLEKWEKLCPFLELTNAEEAIKQTDRDYDEQKKAFLQRWKRQRGRGATYRALIEAARETRNEKLANDIEDMLRLSRDSVPVPLSEQTSQDLQTIQTQSTESSQLVETGSGSSPMVHVASKDEVQRNIEELNKEFDRLKKTIKEYLLRRRIPVKDVADALTSLSPDDDEHRKMFLESHVRVLYAAADNSELFGTMNFHWNYLDPGLLGHLVKKLNLEEVKGEMEAYMSTLQQFRLTTPLTEFCQTQTTRKIKLSPEFEEIVTELHMTNEMTLEDVENFRKEYASHYNVHQFAMMIGQVRSGCFIITWIIPQSLVDKLKDNIPRAILKKYFVSKLEIAGACVYKEEDTCGSTLAPRNGEGFKKASQSSLDESEESPDDIPQDIQSSVTTGDIEPKSFPNTATGAEMMSTNENTYNPPSSGQRLVSAQYVEGKVRKFKKRFKELKKEIEGSLKMLNISVERVTETLRSLSVDDDGHQMFTESHIAVFEEAHNHSALIGHLDFNMDYLSYHLLDCLSNEFGLGDIKDQMEAYKSDLKEFRMKLPLSVFSQTIKRKVIPPGFQEMTAEFNQPTSSRDIHLEDVEQFCHKYATHYNLKLYSMVLCGVECGHSTLKCTWIIPHSVVDLLKTNVPETLLSKYSILKLNIAEATVYISRQGICGVSASSDPKISSEDEYSFVEQPSEDFFCPVTMGLLLQPHQTMCCGNHLSQEAVTRIKIRRKATCPLCNKPQLKTMVDQNFQRKVRALNVSCHFKDSGCGWQGELADLQQHFLSCDFCPKESVTASAVTEISKLLPKFMVDSSLELLFAVFRGDKEKIELLLSQGVDTNTILPMTQTTPLIEACRAEDIQMTFLLLEKGANPNLRDNLEGDTPLIIASLRGHVAIVRLLLERKADVSICDKNGISPLHAASQNGHTEVVDLLVHAGADIHLATTEHGSVPLGIAAQKGHMKTVQRLLDAGATVNHQNKEGVTPLIIASLRGHVAIVRLLLEGNAEVNICDKNGLSPLHVASQNGHTEVVDLLVHAGADIHLATTKNGSVPLEIAAGKRHMKTVQKLLDAGAIVNHQNKEGVTPLIIASLRGNVAIVRLLLEGKAEVNICDKNGLSPLHAASQNGHTEVVDLLLHAGADIHLATTKQGSVPLGIAAGKGHIKTVQRLLDAGATVNHQNKHGASSLHYASQNGHTEVVDLLVHAGADIHLATTKDGSVPLGIAAAKGHMKTVQRLLDAGTIVNNQNKHGASALYNASGNGRTEVVDLLVHAGADIHLATTEYGSAPLMTASRWGHTTVVQRLLEAGANVNQQETIKTTALHYAAENGHSEIVKLLLGAGATDNPDKDGKTAVDKARANTHSEVELLLLQYDNK